MNSGNELLPWIDWTTASPPRFRTIRPPRRALRRLTLAMRALLAALAIGLLLAWGGAP